MMNLSQLPRNPTDLLPPYRESLRRFVMDHLSQKFPHVSVEDRQDGLNVVLLVYTNTDTSTTHREVQQECMLIQHTLERKGHTSVFEFISRATLRHSMTA
jgi:hypothetical protein